MCAFEASSVKFTRYYTFDVFQAASDQTPAAAETETQEDFPVLGAVGGVPRLGPQAWKSSNAADQSMAFPGLAVPVCRPRQLQQNPSNALGPLWQRPEAHQVSGRGRGQPRESEADSNPLLNPLNPSSSTIGRGRGRGRASPGGEREQAGEFRGRAVGQERGGGCRDRAPPGLNPPPCFGDGSDGVREPERRGRGRGVRGHDRGSPCVPGLQEDVRVALPESGGHRFGRGRAAPHLTPPPTSGSGHGDHFGVRKLTEKAGKMSLTSHVKPSSMPPPDYKSKEGK